MKRLTTTLFAMAMILSFSTLALAQDKRDFEPARRAIEASGITVVKADMGKDFRGGEAMVLQSDWDMQKVVDTFIEMLRVGKDLDGQKVVGLAHITLSDTWNVTLRNGDVVTTFKISRDKEKAKASRLTIHKPRQEPNRE